MNTKPFGSTDLLVPPICFGGNVFGWTLDEKESFKLLDELYDKGLRFIDTANNYSRWAPGHVGGESETILGKWFKESKKRHDIVLATKVGGRMGDGTRGLAPDYIRNCVEASLKRLNTEYIDLYQSHYDDLETPQEQTMEVFHALVQEGKVRFIGASNLEPDRIVSANRIAIERGWATYKSVQPLYNLYDRQKFEEEYLPIVLDEKLAVMSYFALASGFLTGKYRAEADLENSKRKDMVKGYLNERGLRILDALDKVAKSHQVSSAQVTTAWQINKPEITTPIISVTSSAQLKELMASCALNLSKEEIAFLDRESAY